VGKLLPAETHLFTNSLQTLFLLYGPFIEYGMTILHIACVRIKQKTTCQGTSSIAHDMADSSGSNCSDTRYVHSKGLS